MAKLVALLAPILLLCSCTRLTLDPGAGAETIFLRTLDHSEHFDVRYERTPEEGPLRLRKNAWTYLYFVPVNHPDMGLWLEQTLPPGTVAANVRSSTRLPWYGPFVIIPTLGLVHVRSVEFEAQPVTFLPKR
jgi:hypothetical protein